MKRLFISLALFTAVVSCSKIQQDDPTPGPKPDPKPVIPDPELIYPAPEPSDTSFVRAAYFPYYYSFSAATFPDSMFSHIDVACYAFASMTDAYIPAMQQPSVAREVVRRCHQHNVKAVLSFAGSWLDKRFTTMSCSGELRNKFVAETMKLVEEYGFDGVDNDWEYPSSADGSKRGNLLLMRQLSNELHAPGVGKTLSMALTSGKYEGSYTSGIDAGVYDCCDWFGVMAYDDSQPHSPLSLLQAGFDFWVGKAKMPLKKFVGGLPCYGRGREADDKWNKSKSYSTLVTTYGADPDSDEVETDGYMTNYNGRKTIAAKVNYLIEKDAGGYFFWEAGQDLYDSRSLIATADSTLTAALMQE